MLIYIQVGKILVGNYYFFFLLCSFLFSRSDIWLDLFPNGPATMFLKVDAELLFQTSSVNSNGAAKFCSSFASFSATNNCPLQTETSTSPDQVCIFIQQRQGEKLFYFIVILLVSLLKE